LDSGRIIHKDVEFSFSGTLKESGFDNRRVAKDLLPRNQARHAALHGFIAKPADRNAETAGHDVQRQQFAFHAAITNDPPRIEKESNP